MARPERIKLEKGTFKKAATFFRFIKPEKELLNGIHFLMSHIPN